MRFLPYLVLLAEVILFYRHVLFLGHVIPWDLSGFFLPHMHSYVDALQSGELPLWDPSTYCGRPLQANIQAGVFYPPVALVAMIGSLWGHEHLRYLLELNVIFHVLLAGVFSYWLGLALGLSRPSAVMLGTVYQLGGFFAAHSEHMTAVQVAAWIPFAFWCVVKTQAGIPVLRHLKPALLLAAGFAMATLAGLATLTAALFVLSILLALLLQWRTVGIVAFAIAAAILLTLVQLAPTFQLTNLSIAQYRSDYLHTGGGLPLSALASLVIPNYNGVFHAATFHGPADLTFMYLFSGWIALALALYALFRRSSWIFAVMLVITGLIALGDSTPLGKLVLTMLPVKIRIGLEPEYVASAFLLCLAVLAAMGLDQVIRNPRWRWGLVAIAAIELIVVSSGHEMNAMPAANDPSWSRTQFEGDAGALERVRAMLMHSNPPDRFDTTGGAMNWAMAAPSIGLPTANGNDPFALTRYMSVRRLFTGGERWGSYYEVRDPQSPLLGMLNVRLLISRQGVSEVPNVLPRFRLVSTLRKANSEAEALGMLRSTNRETVVEGFDGQTPAGEGTVRVMEFGMNRVRLQVDAAAPSFLVTSEVNYPGWKATIDTRDTPIYYTNVAFRGLAVPAGAHTVEMQFSPPLLRWTGAISLAGWLAWGVLWFWKARGESVAPR